jgi:hypothetical protein
VTNSVPSGFIGEENLAWEERKAGFSTTEWVWGDEEVPIVRDAFFEHDDGEKLCPAFISEAEEVLE